MDKVQNVPKAVKPMTIFYADDYDDGKGNGSILQFQIDKKKQPKLKKKDIFITSDNQDNEEDSMNRHTASLKKLQSNREKKKNSK